MARDNAYMLFYNVDSAHCVKGPRSNNSSTQPPQAMPVMGRTRSSSISFVGPALPPDDTIRTAFIGPAPPPPPDMGVTSFIGPAPPPPPDMGVSSFIGPAPPPYGSVSAPKRQHRYEDDEKENDSKKRRRVEPSSLSLEASQRLGCYPIHTRPLNRQALPSRLLSDQDRDDVYRNAVQSVGQQSPSHVNIIQQYGRGRDNVLDKIFDQVEGLKHCSLIEVGGGLQMSRLMADIPNAAMRIKEQLMRKLIAMTS